MQRVTHDSTACVFAMCSMQSCAMYIVYHVTSCTFNIHFSKGSSLPDVRCFVSKKSRSPRQFADLDKHTMPAHACMLLLTLAALVSIPVLVSEDVIVRYSRHYNTVHYHRHQATNLTAFLAAVQFTLLQPL